ncbi:MAG: hypothetical protein R3253_08915 [Longimicrobiales bacterium]|nr:hypothetical protein [Longimicrobiales bacterium]
MLRRRGRARVPELGLRRKGFWSWVAAKLPPELVYWCGCRIIANGTTGEWSRGDLERVTAAAMLMRYRKMRGGEFGG